MAKRGAGQNQPFERCVPSQRKGHPFEVSIEERNGVVEGIRKTTN